MIYTHSTSQMVSIHLADTSIDARALLGSYCSSSKEPGTFEWIDGVVVRALREGKMLVLEDIDKASGEVLGTLWPLVESLSLAKPIGSHACLQVPGRDLVQAKEGFTLFATSSYRADSLGNNDAFFLGAQKWRKVRLEPPKEEEIGQILSIRFPSLPTGAILYLWQQINEFISALPHRDNRGLNVRELLKWSHRIQDLLASTSNTAMDIDNHNAPFSSPNSIPRHFTNPALREEMYIEARDIFFGSVPSSDPAYIPFATTFAHVLDIPEDRVKWILEERAPELEVVKRQDGTIAWVSIGRIKLDALPRNSTISTPTFPFALHRPSLELLGRIAACVHLSEPVLLTGETGTGKTTAVSYLASILSRRLVSLNLSNQTESSDLIGGFKPVDARGPGAKLQERFLQLFSSTFSREKNMKFEEAIRVAVSGGKWKRSVALWKEASARAKERIKSKMEENAIERFV